MPAQRKRPENAPGPKRRVKSPQEPKDEGRARPQTPKKPRASQTKKLSENQLLQFANSFYYFHEWMIYLAYSIDHPAPLRQRFAKHLGTEASLLPVLSETFEGHDHLNIQRTLDRYLAGDVVEHELVGVSGGRNLSLSDMIGMKARSGLETGPVDQVNIPSGPETVEVCVRTGIYFIVAEGKPSILHLRGPDPSCGRENCIVEVVSPDTDRAKDLLGGLREGIHRDNVFRGQVISFADTNIGRYGVGPLVFWERSNMSSEDLILPAGLLEQIEEQVFGIAEHRDRLRLGGQHLKRGLLLHGPPGTGKTHTVRYLLGKASEHTVVVLTGAALRYVREACALARLLQPAIVVLEDVDLVAKNREYGGTGNPLLFDVLNQLDGISDDADIVFVLTTNRADLLEPALAARPGRVDLAIEIPLPGDDERRGLYRLYGRRLIIGHEVEDEVVRRTDGVTASFLRELVRKAALHSAVSGSGNGKIRVEDAHVLAALDELLADRSALTRVLLGQKADGNESSFAGSGWL